MELMPEILAKMRRLSASEVRSWLENRIHNMHRLAVMVDGKKREQWIEDAAYLTAIAGLVNWTEANRQDFEAAAKAADDIMNSRVLQ